MSQFLRRCLLGTLSGVLLSCAMIPAVSAQSGGPGGSPQDWSHRHLVYSSVETRDEAVRKGTLHFEEWKKKNKDPRFALRAERKAQFDRTSDQNPFSPRQLQWSRRHDRNPPAAGPAIHRDWSAPLGSAAGVGRAGVFPAKFSFDVNATPSCANDFVVFTTASSGATASGSGTAATRSGTFSARPSTDDTVTIVGIDGTRLILTVGSSNSGTTFTRGNNGATGAATNLAAAINRTGNGSSVGVTATSANGVVTITATTPGSAGNSITLSDSSDDFTWNGTSNGTSSLVGGADPVGQPTIVAFNNLYKTPTCAGAVPNAHWAYNTGNGAFTETSPVLSLDGSQVAFIQRSSTNVASLVLLKWKAGTGTVAAPTALTSQSPANYRSCAVPCMTVMTLNANDTNSSPFYDYGADILYVGDNSGKLHKFTGVFNGTPAEQVDASFPATVSSGNMLSSPVYDFGTDLIFVGSSVTNATNSGRLHSINATSGAVVSSGLLSATTGQDAANNPAQPTGVRDGPIVDSTARRVYVFVENDTSTGAGCPGTATSGNLNNNAPCKAVYQFQTNVSINGITGAKVNVGRGQVAGRVLYSGAFDNAYYNSANGTNPSGNLYVCGGLQDATYSDSKKPTLWKIPIVNNGFGSPVEGPSLVGALPYSNKEANCSPVTEIMNGADEFIYASVTAWGTTTGCNGNTVATACVYMYKIAGSGAITWNNAAAATAGLPAAGGTGGIIVDNISTTTGASQIYYSTLTSPGNAVQASQAALN